MRSSIPRRGFLKKGLLGGALLFFGGALPIALRPGRRGAAPRRPLELLTPDEHAVMAAIAARVVPGDGAGPSWPSAEALDCAGKIDALMAQAHPRVGTEFRQLLRLFENGLTGLLTTLQPTPFTKCAPDQQDARLESWRHSRVALLRSGYQALKRLSQAAYYSSPEIYARVGYPGPPEVPQRP
ncbi:MAG TPA: gluconate 2-dehydrogenase subunit 3 family protein [Polyangia bacterium]|nr:gluconate 2-dehydrogenase subunit 3 family protein [Polyangia bacterium]